LPINKALKIQNISLVNPARRVTMGEFVYPDNKDLVTKISAPFDGSGSRQKFTKYQVFSNLIL
jgi:hypothetical protein